jgi:hypothetical protein
LIRWLLALFGVTLLSVVFAVFSDAIYRNAWVYFTGCFFLVSNLYMLIVARSVMNTQSKTINGMLGAVALKQLFSLVFIMIYLVKFYREDNNEVWICLGSFFMFSIVSYYFSFISSK